MQRSKLYTAALVAAMATTVSATAAASTYEVSVTNLTNSMHFTPLVLATHSPSAQKFSAGTATFMIDDGEGDVFSMSGMLLPTNDGFVGVSSAALPTGAAGARVVLNVLGYDAGTEANDEVVGSGAPGEAGFPAPPPVVDTGTGASGVPTHDLFYYFVHTA